MLVGDAKDSDRIALINEITDRVARSGEATKQNGLIHLRNATNNLLQDVGLESAKNVLSAVLDKKEFGGSN